MYRIFVQGDPEFGDQSPYIELLHISKLTNDAIEMVVKRIASHYRSHNVRFKTDNAGEIFTVTVTASFDSKYFFEFTDLAFQKIMDSLEQSVYNSQEIREVKELLVIRDKFEAMRNETSREATEFKRTISEGLKSTDIFFEEVK